MDEVQKLKTDIEIGKDIVNLAQSALDIGKEANSYINKIGKRNRTFWDYVGDGLVLGVKGLFVKLQYDAIRDEIIAKEQQKLAEEQRQAEEARKLQQMIQAVTPILLPTSPKKRRAKKRSKRRLHKKPYNV